MAMIMANSSFSWLYSYLTELRVTVSIDTFIIDKPLLHWINDGFMAFFFFMIGLEIKREIVHGNLKKKIVLPIFAALGGMLIPALFTMSLFIGSLAFQCSSKSCYGITDDRLGILICSFLSGVGGYYLLKYQLRKRPSHKSK